MAHPSLRPKPRCLAPVVAGIFYPASPATLATTVDAHLDVGRQRIGAPRARVVVAPHAGYDYSGPIAGSAFAALELRGMRRVVVIGPSHRFAFDGLALPDARQLATPLGTLDVDPVALETLAVFDDVRIEPRAYAQEHAIEVELPFVQRRDEAIRVVPLVVGRAGRRPVARVLEALLDETTALVVSSDLSHFLDHETASRVDRQTASRIEGLATDLRPDEACGAAVLNGLAVVAHRRGWRAETLDRRTSGDTAGDRQRVVGYGAFAFGP